MSDPAPPRYAFSDTDRTEMPDGSSVGVGTAVTRPRPPAPIARCGVAVGGMVGGMASAVMVRMTACEVAFVSGTPPMGVGNVKGVRTTVGTSAGKGVSVGVEAAVGVGCVGGGACVGSGAVTCWFGAGVGDGTGVTVNAAVAKPTTAVGTGFGTTSVGGLVGLGSTGDCNGDGSGLLHAASIRANAAALRPARRNFMRSV